ncbi:DNA (cytosine-5)-methyltransferase 1 [Lentzea albidocapillata subsp. violacea]|uniref:DNA (cytosine-5-)-methyltransferase n=1 Tax=Lentzea albidocapillata subsp. violacea TaxID=128104 RepID=A0A1G8XGS6_9PSEU|nr:DNA cytosine methyltransferase [Lentzea albidocapillata]SDJ89788.1 DNA (cytosine-5)-methyltransferase 1 [Lentzea albidocapillata subsp. violacea]
MVKAEKRFSSLDVCAGAGGLALGLEQAGFDPVLLIDNRDVACETLRVNRPHWHVLEMDLMEFVPDDYPQVYDVDLLSAGLPRVQASATATRRHGSEAELELLKATIMLVPGVQPRALVVENVPDLAVKPGYESIRDFVAEELGHLGYRHRWFVLNAADHGVAQSREQGILVAFKGDAMDFFEEPAPSLEPFVTVGDALRESMSARGWQQAEEWAKQADKLAPTLVGGSWKRGGPDLGPTGSKRAWAKMGVDGGTLADDVPGPDFDWNPGAGRAGMVKLTVEQAATLQGFPAQWQIAGRKTVRYRQIGHASPPPVGQALGQSIRAALARSSA